MLKLVEPLMDSEELSVICPHCSERNLPDKIYEPTCVTWSICGGISLVGCWVGLCLIPLLNTKAFQHARLYCNFCKQEILYTYNKPISE